MKLLLWIKPAPNTRLVSDYHDFQIIGMSSSDYVKDSINKLKIINTVQIAVIDIYNAVTA